MATVRISDALVRSVKNFNRIKLENIRRGLPKPRDVFDNEEVLLKAYDLITGGIRHTLENNPLEPYLRKDDVWICTFSGGDMAPGHTHSSSYAAAEKELPVPRLGASNDYGVLEPGGSIRLNAQHPEWVEMYAEACRLQEEYNALENQHYVAINQLEHLLKSHTTLGPALRQFPALWDMLPDDIKAQHTRVETRVKSTGLKTVTDTSVLTQAVMTAKLLSGENNGQ